MKRRVSTWKLYKDEVLFFFFKDEFCWMLKMQNKWGRLGFIARARIQLIWFPLQCIICFLYCLFDGSVYKCDVILKSHLIRFKNLTGKQGNQETKGRHSLKKPNSTIRAEASVKKLSN